MLPVVVFYKLKARLSTHKKIPTHFTVILALVGLSGTKTTLPPRYCECNSACCIVSVIYIYTFLYSGVLKIQSLNQQISIIWGLVRNANPRAPFQTTGIKNWGWAQLVVIEPPSRWFQCTLDFVESWDHSNLKCTRWFGTFWLAKEETAPATFCQSQEDELWLPVEGSAAWGWSNLGPHHKYR